MASENEVVKILRSLVISSDQADFRSLISDYRAEAGEAIPFRKLGYDSLEDFLRASGEFNLFETANGIRVTAKTTQESAHIADLRRNQTVSKTARRRRNAPTIQPNRLPPRLSIQRNDGLAQQKIMELTRQLQSLQQAQQIQQMQHFQQIRQLQAANEMQQRRAEAELRQMRAMQEEKQKQSILAMQAIQDIRERKAMEEIQQLKAIQTAQQINAMQAMQEAAQLKRIQQIEQVNQSNQLMHMAEKFAILQQQSLINQRLNPNNITNTSSAPSPLEQKPTDKERAEVCVNKNKSDSENSENQQSPLKPTNNNAIEKLLSRVNGLNLGETPSVGEVESNLSPTTIKEATPEKVQNKSESNPIKIVEQSAANCKNSKVSDILAMRAKQFSAGLPKNSTPQKPSTGADTERQVLKGVKISVNNRLAQIKSTAQIDEPNEKSIPKNPFQAIQNTGSQEKEVITNDAKRTNDSIDGELRTFTESKSIAQRLDVKEKLTEPNILLNRRKIFFAPRPLKQAQTNLTDTVDAKHTASNTFSKECDDAAREVNEMVCMSNKNYFSKKCANSNVFINLFFLHFI